MNVPRIAGEPAAVLFDLDGTLVDTVETRIEAWSRVFVELGLQPRREQLAGLIGSDGRRLARLVFESAGQVIDDEQSESVDKRAGQIFDALNQDPKPLAGVLEVIQWLDRRGLPWAIATASRREQVRRSVEALGLPDEPRVIDGTHVKNAKPDPELLLFAAKELGVDPARVWYVGDSIWDVQAAKAAGMTAIGVATGAADRATLTGAGANVAVGGMRDLIPILERVADGASHPPS